MIKTDKLKNKLNSKKTRLVFVKISFIWMIMLLVCIGTPFKVYAGASEDNLIALNIETPSILLGECAYTTLTVSGKETQTVTRIPLNVVLMLDDSGSMGTGTRLADLKTAANNFIDTLTFDGDNPDKVAIFSYDGQTRTCTASAGDANSQQDLTYTSTKSTITNEINSLDDQGATPLWDTIGDAIDYAVNNQEQGRVSVVIVMTDGDDVGDGEPFGTPNGYSDIEGGSERYSPWHNWGVTQTLTSKTRTFYRPSSMDYLTCGNNLGNNICERTVNFGSDSNCGDDSRLGLLYAPIPVFTIGLGIYHPGATDPYDPTTSESDLYQIAITSPNGEYYYAPNSADLTNIYDSIATVVSNYIANDVLVRFELPNNDAGNPTSTVTYQTITPCSPPTCVKRVCTTVDDCTESSCAGTPDTSESGFLKWDIGQLASHESYIYTFPTLPHETGTYPYGTNSEVTYTDPNDNALSLSFTPSDVVVTAIQPVVTDIELYESGCGAVLTKVVPYNNDNICVKATIEDDNLDESTVEGIFNQIGYASASPVVADSCTKTGTTYTCTWNSLPITLTTPGTYPVTVNAEDLDGHTASRTEDFVFTELTCTADIGFKILSDDADALIELLDSSGQVVSTNLGCGDDKITHTFTSTETYTFRITPTGTLDNVNVYLGDSLSFSTFALDTQLDLTPNIDYYNCNYVYTPEMICCPDEITTCDTGLLGVCAEGTETCNSDGLSWTSCTQINFPTPEICDGEDNDCDDEIDEDGVCDVPPPGCDPEDDCQTPGETRPCNPGCSPPSKIALVLDDNNQCEDMQDIPELYDILVNQNGFDVTLMDESGTTYSTPQQLIGFADGLEEYCKTPSGTSMNPIEGMGGLSTGLPASAISDYELVWFVNPGFPMDDVATLDTLEEHIDYGFVVVFQGDDLTKLVGDQDRIESFTGLDHISNGNNVDYRVYFESGTNNHPIIQSIAGDTVIYQGDDIDENTMFGSPSNFESLASAEKMDGSDSGHAIVVRDYTGEFGGIVVTMLLTLDKLEPASTAKTVVSNLVNWALIKTGNCDGNTDLSSNGFETCQDDCTWSGCTSVPQPEICNGIDDDGDGAIDEAPLNCGCVIGDTKPCTGDGVGICTSCKQTCLEDPETGWGYWDGICGPAETCPQTEICDGLDNNCDGNVDEGTAATRVCYPDGYDEVSFADLVLATDPGSTSICLPGTQTCEAVIGSGEESWTICDAVGPETEACDDEIDNNCDGVTNEGCGCIPNEYPQQCGVTDVGICEFGEVQCIEHDDGTTEITDCIGEIPDNNNFASLFENTEELCSDEDDNDCDGLTDCEDPDCVEFCVNCDDTTDFRMGYSPNRFNILSIPRINLDLGFNISKHPASSYPELFEIVKTGVQVEECNIFDDHLLFDMYVRNELPFLPEGTTDVSNNPYSDIFTFSFDEEKLNELHGKFHTYNCLQPFPVNCTVLIQKQLLYEGTVVDNCIERKKIDFEVVPEYPTIDKKKIEGIIEKSKKAAKAADVMNKVNNVFDGISQVCGYMPKISSTLMSAGTPLETTGSVIAKIFSKAVTKVGKGLYKAGVGIHYVGNKLYYSGNRILHWYSTKPTEKVSFSKICAFLQCNYVTPWLKAINTPGRKAFGDLAQRQADRNLANDADNSWIRQRADEAIPDYPTAGTFGFDISRQSYIGNILNLCIPGMLKDAIDGIEIGCRKLKCEYEQLNPENQGSLDDVNCNILFKKEMCMKFLSPAYKSIGFLNIANMLVNWMASSIINFPERFADSMYQAMCQGKESGGFSTMGAGPATKFNDYKKQKAERSFGIIIGCHLPKSYVAVKRFLREFCIAPPVNTEITGSDQASKDERERARREWRRECAKQKFGDMFNFKKLKEDDTNDCNILINTFENDPYFEISMCNTLYPNKDET